MKKNAFILILAAMLASSAVSVPVSAYFDEGGTEILMEEDENDLLPSGWKTINGKKYYYVDGKPVKKNTTVHGIRYVFDTNGECQGRYTGKTKLNGKTVGYVNGIMQTGWYKIKDKWYYGERDGSLRKGWTAIYENSRYIKGRKFYYFNEKGEWDGIETHTYDEYKPETLGDLLRDYSFPDDVSYTARAEVFEKKFVDFDGISVIKDILEENADQVISHDERTSSGFISRVQKNPDDYIMINSGEDVRGEDSMPTFFIYRRKSGKFSFYMGNEWRFGCELEVDDGSFYEELLESIEEKL